MNAGTVQLISFLVVAATCLVGAIGVVTARSVFTSALYLVLALFGVAGFYVLLNAGFLAVVQVLIYVGAISVLILFAVMLTPDVMHGGRLTQGQWALGGLISLTLFGLLGMVSYSTDWPMTADAMVPSGGALVVTGEGALSAEEALALGATEEVDANGETILRIPGTVERLGTAFVTEYLLQFEVISVLLLVALVGAIAVARE